MSKVNSKYDLIVEYNGQPDAVKQSKIKSLVGRSSSGSGYDFMSGCRDMCFNFQKEQAIAKAIMRLKKIKVKCVVYETIEGDQIRKIHGSQVGKFCRNALKEKHVHKPCKSAKKSNQ